MPNKRQVSCSDTVEHLRTATAEHSSKLGPSARGSRCHCTECTPVQPALARARPEERDWT